MKDAQKAIVISCIRLACASCGEAIYPDDKYKVCPDCAAIFCQSCCEDGITFDRHECQEF